MMSCPTFYADYELIKTLVSSNIRISSRFIYLEVLKGAFDWFVDLNPAFMMISEEKTKHWSDRIAVEAVETISANSLRASDN